jgi:hypothetical protein
MVHPLQDNLYITYKHISYFARHISSKYYTRLFIVLKKDIALDSPLCKKELNFPR